MDIRYVEPKLPEVLLANECVDYPDRVLLRDILVNVFRKQRSLGPVSLIRVVERRLRSSATVPPK